MKISRGMNTLYRFVGSVFIFTRDLGRRFTVNNQSESDNGSKENASK